MRKLILKISLSVDGFVGGSHGELDWIFKTLSDDAVAWEVASVWEAGVHIMGSRTFRDMAAYWPTSKEPFAAPMNEIPKAVFTRRGLAAITEAHPTEGLEDANRANAAARKDPASVTAEVEESWRNPYVASGNLAEEIARLKAQPGKPILAHGGASFVRSLVAGGLIDEYRLLVHPVLLGKGLPIFSDLPAARFLVLDQVKTFSGGVAAHIYRAA
jgi:dihydrofolate reductase